MYYYYTNYTHMLYIELTTCITSAEDMNVYDYEHK